jgi:hypothetical protein
MLLLLPLLDAQAAERRVALVVGVGAYKNVPTLLNPPNDARDIAAALIRLGFETETLVDPDRLALESAARDLANARRTRTPPCSSSRGTRWRQRAATGSSRLPPTSTPTATSASRRWTWRAYWSNSTARLGSRS